jgi:hypothetical protein
MTQSNEPSNSLSNKSLFKEITGSWEQLTRQGKSHTYKNIFLQILNKIKTIRIKAKAINLKSVGSFY